MHIWEVDVFEGANKGLVMAEIELGAIDEKFEVPDWIGEEVSEDGRYYNIYLLKQPYCQWSDWLFATIKLTNNWTSCTDLAL